MSADPSPPIDTSSFQSRQPPLISHYDDVLNMTHVVPNRTSFEQVSDARSHVPHYQHAIINSRSTMMSGRTGYAARDRLSESTARQSATFSVDNGVPWLGDCSLLLKTSSEDDMQYLHHCLGQLPSTLESIFRIRHAAVSSHEMDPVAALKFNLYVGWVTSLMARVETAAPTLHSNNNLNEVTESAAMFAAKWRAKNLGVIHVIETGVVHPSFPLVQGAREFSASTADPSTDVTPKIVEFAAASMPKNVCVLAIFSLGLVTLAALGLAMLFELHGRELAAAVASVLAVALLMCLPVVLLLRALRRVHCVAQADNLALRQLSRASFRLLAESRHDAETRASRQVQPFTAPPPPPANELHSGVDRSNSTQPPTAANARAAVGGSVRGPRRVSSSTDSEPDAMLIVPKAVLQALAVCAIDAADTNVVLWSDLMREMTGVAMPALLSEALSPGQAAELSKLQQFWDTDGRAKPPGAIATAAATRLTLHLGVPGRRGMSLCLEATAALLSGKPAVLLVHAANHQCPQLDLPVQPASNSAAHLTGSLRVQRALLRFALNPLCRSDPTGDALPLKPLVHFAPAALDMQRIRATPAHISGPTCPEMHVAEFGHFFKDSHGECLALEDATLCHVYQCPHVATDGLRRLAPDLAPCLSAARNRVRVRVAPSDLDPDVAILEVRITAVPRTEADTIRMAFDDAAVPAIASVLSVTVHPDVFDVIFAMPCARASQFTLDELGHISSSRRGASFVQGAPVTRGDLVSAVGSSLLPPQAAPDQSAYSLASPRGNPLPGWTDDDDDDNRSPSLNLDSDQLERSAEAAEDQEDALRVLIIGSDDKTGVLSDTLVSTVTPKPLITIIDNSARLRSVMGLSSFQFDLAVIFDTFIGDFGYSAQQMRSEIFGRPGWGATVVIVHVEPNDAGATTAALQPKRDLTADGRAGTPFASGSLLCVPADARAPDEGESYQILAADESEPRSICRLWSTVDAHFDDDFVQSLICHPADIKSSEKRRKQRVFEPLITAFQQDPPKTLVTDDSALTANSSSKVRFGEMTTKGGTTVLLAVKRVTARTGDVFEEAALRELQVLQLQREGKLNFVVRLKKCFGQESPARSGAPRRTDIVLVLERCEPLTAEVHGPPHEPYTLNPATDIQAERAGLVRTLRVLRQVAMALRSLHVAGWVHGNLTKDHVMMAHDSDPSDTFPWSVRLVGLGSARRVDSPNPAPAEGPQAHRDPPDALAPLGPHVDVYALGVLAMDLTGWAPPDDGTASTLPLCQRVSDHFAKASTEGLSPEMVAIREDLKNFIVVCLLPVSHAHSKFRAGYTQFRAEMDLLLSNGLLSRSIHRQPELTSPRGT